MNILKQRWIYIVYNNDIPEKARVSYFGTRPIRSLGVKYL